MPKVAQRRQKASQYLYRSNADAQGITIYIYLFIYLYICVYIITEQVDSSRCSTIDNDKEVAADVQPV